MTKRDNHYECAFEEFLRSRGVPYVAVDETRRALLANQSLKSLDFIVSPPGVNRLLVDVKGRRFLQAHRSNTGKTGPLATTW